MPCVACTLPSIHAVLQISASIDSNRQGMNILVVKGTVHAGMKEVRAKITMIHLAGFDAGKFKEFFKEEKITN